VVGFNRPEGRASKAYVVAQAETGVEMITIPELVAQALGSFLTAETKGRLAQQMRACLKSFPMRPD